ncbi:Uncharacterised protein [Vibrio cholerae]|nr:Uncharacterised protein [Vibrio cholerae]CSI36158.1 Uncharacterised protein [Vibrio cholerae]
MKGFRKRQVLLQNTITVIDILWIRQQSLVT